MVNSKNISDLTNCQLFFLITICLYSEKVKSYNSQHSSDVEVGQLPVI